MRLALQQKVKQNLLETKYAEEPVSYEQALVTYHFMQNAPIQDVAQPGPSPAANALARSGTGTKLPAKQGLSQLVAEAQQRQGSESPGARTVQFDLA